MIANLKVTRAAGLLVLVLALCGGGLVSVGAFTRHTTRAPWYATTTCRMSGRSVMEVDVDDGTVQFAMEQTVKRYFQGVHEKNPTKIRRCFGETALIHDIVVGRDTASAPVRRTGDELVQRCLDFVTAHPDVEISFLYGPECGRSSSHWVVTHWYETGTWSGFDAGGVSVSPTAPMRVQGQTRCRVDPETMTIVELVVTRTYSEWEMHVAAASAARTQPDATL